MNAKLHINLLQGVLEVEGDEKFVQSIYQDFKSHLPKQSATRNAERRANEPAEIIDHESSSSHERRRRRGTRRTGDGETAKIADYAPKLNSNLDLKDLRKFYGQFDPKNHSEKILIFAVFLRDSLKIVPCSADDVYTCYRELKDITKIPEAFVQAIRDAQNKAGAIDFVSQTEIKITIAGENYFTQKLKRKELAE